MTVTLWRVTIFALCTMFVSGVACKHEPNAESADIGTPKVATAPSAPAPFDAAKQIGLVLADPVCANPAQANFAAG